MLPGLTAFPFGGFCGPKCDHMRVTARKTCSQFQLSAHRPNDVPKRAQVHVGSPFDLGDRALINSKLSASARAWYSALARFSTRFRTSGRIFWKSFSNFCVIGFSCPVSQTRL